MKARFTRLLLVGVLLVSLVGVATWPRTAAAQRPDAPIYLKAGMFYPTRGERLNAPAELMVSDFAAGVRGTYLVQFAGPVEQAWKDAVAEAGAEVLEYIPDYTFKVRMSPAQAAQVRQQMNVAWVGVFQPAYKLNPKLDRSGVRLYALTLERGADAAANTALLNQLGASVLAQADGHLLIAADGALVDALAAVLDVAWVDNFYLRETHGTVGNEYGAGNIIGAAVANGRGYDGSTQIVTVADTGLGGGTLTTAHADIPSSRMVAIYNWPGVNDTCWTITDDGAIDVDSGHGTHVATSVLGDGNATGLGKGTAPAARLVFQSTENWATMKGICAILYANGYYLTGIPTNLSTLFQQAYDAGARIHSNSWGSAAAGDYTADSVYADSFVWSHPDMLISFSAGNEGIDANSDGVIDNDSIGSPATAKNVLTVGASENDRQSNWQCDTALSYTTCAAQGGENTIATYGTSWPTDYPANPIKDDPAAGNANQMAAFSSRGPTDDARIKPDVVAPGTWILSGFSDLYQQGYDASANPKNGAWQYDGWGFPFNAQYKYMGGTSMSNPITAGGAAVIKDYYQKVYALNASAALVKATLINSAVDLLDENNDGFNDNDFPIPNNHEGWGRIDLNNATDGTAQYAENTAGLSTNGTATYQYTVGTAGLPLRFTVAWSDYPSTDTASVNLVNNLDVEVTAPGGTVYKGNVFSGGWSIAGGAADTRNNVENVYIQSAAAGTWTVTVKGFNVPSGPQPFALVADGSFGPAGPTPTPGPTNTPVPPTSTPTPTNTPVPPTNTGLLSPAANSAVTSSAGDNNGYQTTPSNAHSNDGLYAVDTNSGTNNNTSCTNSGKDKHLYRDYNIALTGAVRGIEVRVDARADSTSGAPKICVQLSWNGGTSWTAAKSTTTLTTAEATYTLGGAADTWGRAWTATELNNTNFRVRVIDVASSTARDFSLDWVAVRVTYQP